MNFIISAQAICFLNPLVELNSNMIVFTHKYLPVKSYGQKNGFFRLFDFGVRGYIINFLEKIVF